MLRVLYAVRRNVRKSGAGARSLAVVGMLPGLPSCQNCSASALRWFLAAGNTDGTISDKFNGREVDSEGCGDIAGSAEGFAADVGERDLVWV
jgi:hypothetical protein